MVAIDAIAFMDRRLRTGATGLSAVYSGGVTTFTLPYAVAVDGSDGDLRVARESTQALVTSTRPSENQIAVAGIDLTAEPVIIGVLYQFVYTPSPPYLRDSKGGSDLTARLTLHHIIAKYGETISIGSRVTRTGRPGVSKQMNVFTVPRKGDFIIPIHSDRDEVQVSIQDSTASSLSLTGLTWSGTVRSPGGRKV